MSACFDLVKSASLSFKATQEKEGFTHAFLVGYKLSPTSSSKLSRHLAYYYVHWLCPYHPADKISAFYNFRRLYPYSLIATV